MITRENFEIFLYQALNESFQQLKVKVSDEAGFYVHNLLKTYIKSETFKTLSGLGDSEKPLVVLIDEAKQEPTQSGQMWKLVAIGDHSFYIASFLEGNVNRHFKNREYCIGIGSNSYLSAYDLSPEKNLAHLFKELGENFEKLVYVAANALEA